MDVSIVTISYNTRELLQRMLESVQKTVKQSKHEIIVVDNNSSDGSVEMIQESFPEVLLIANRMNLGFSKANNQGAGHARGELLLLLNPDTVVNENAIDQMVQFLRNEPQASAVGCKLLNEDGSLQRSCGLFPNLLIELFTRTLLNKLFPKSRLFNMHKLSPSNYSITREVDWATAACLLVRKKKFDAVSGFDENIFMFYDDVELCLRIRQQGWKIFFFPDASVYHYHGGSWKSRREIPIKQNIVNAIYYYRKHHGKTELAILHILLLLEIVLTFCVAVFWQALREPPSVTRSRLSGLWGGLKYLLFRKQ